MKYIRHSTGGSLRESSIVNRRFYKCATHCGLYFTKDDVVDATAQMYCCAAPRPPC